MRISKEKIRRKRRLRWGRFLLGLALIAGVLLLILWPRQGQPEEVSSSTPNTGESRAADPPSDLAQLVAQYPEARPLLEHPENYPEPVREMALHNPETLEYVLQYPDRKDSNPEYDLSKEVKKGEFPLFLQWDARWGYTVYGDGRLGWTGCGPTCLAMVSAGLTGRSQWDPKTVAAYAQRGGYYESGAGTKWTLMTDGAKGLGLNGRELSLSKGEMEQALSKGQPIICAMGPGDFTTSGHYIVLTGVSGGKFTVLDPNSPSRSRQTWSYDRIAPQIKNLWAYRAA